MNGNVSPAKLEPPPVQPIEDVGLLAGHLHLEERLLADHGLVQEDVVEHRAERVLRVVARRRVLDRLADRDPERARVGGGRLEDGAAVARWSATGWRRPRRRTSP